MINDTQTIKLHTAAQLLLQGYPEECVVGGFTEEEVQQARIMAEEIRQSRNGNARPAAAALTTTDWLRRRIMLRITSIPSKMLALHRRVTQS